LGVPVAVTTTAPGQKGAFTFNGFAGQRVSVAPLGIPIFPFGYLTLKDPWSTSLDSMLAGAAPPSFVGPVTLPSSGLFTVEVDPEKAKTGTMTVVAYDVPPDVTGVLQVDGPAAPVPIDAPGQNAAFTFEGMAGQTIRMRYWNVTMCMNFELFRLDGTTEIVAGSSFACPTSGFPGGAITSFFSLPATEMYHVRITPDPSHNKGYTGMATVQVTTY
jgi:hypothetical protein